MNLGRYISQCARSAGRRDAWRGRRGHRPGTPSQCMGCPRGNKRWACGSGWIVSPSYLIIGWAVACGGGGAAPAAACEPDGTTRPAPPRAAAPQHRSTAASASPAANCCSSRAHLPNGMLRKWTRGAAASCALLCSLHPAAPPCFCRIPATRSAMDKRWP